MSSWHASNCSRQCMHKYICVHYIFALSSTLNVYRQGSIQPISCCNNVTTDLPNKPNSTTSIYNPTVRVNTSQLHLFKAVFHFYFSEQYFYPYNEHMKYDSTTIRIMIFALQNYHWFALQKWSAKSIPMGNWFSQSTFGVQKWIPNNNGKVIDFHSFYLFIYNHTLFWSSCDLNLQN